MFSRMMLMFCVVALVTIASAAPSPTVVLYPDGRINSSPLDNEEPDTLYYDDDLAQSFYFNQLTNYWVYVRFTPPAAFQLRSVYIAVGSPSGSAVPCSVFVCLPGASNRPGTVLSTTSMASVPAGSAWFDFTLDDSVDLDANQDFMIVVGRAPGPTGWYPLLDGGSTVNRSWYTTGSRTSGTYNNVAYDMRIRAGGSFAQFTDLEAQQCFNQVNSADPQFFMLSADSVLMKANVFNPGSAEVDLYTVTWTVNGPGGGQVFSNEVVGANIAAGATQTLQADQIFAVTTEGEYLARCVVTADSDASALNDTTWLRMFVGALPMWYRYDDNGDPEGSVSFGAGDETAVSFTPTEWPARVESLRVNVSGAISTSLSVYINDANGMPGAQPEWSGQPNLAAGWNNVAVSPGVYLADDQSFTVSFLHTGSVGIGKDNNPPNAAAISGMGTISWQGSGGTWSADPTGNWLLQGYAVEHIGPPPVPFIDTNLDTLDFGQVDTAAVGEVITLWVYNLGTVDPLQVTGMVINPPNIRTSYSLSRTSFSVAAGDSEDVQVTFTPVGVSVYNGAITIANNSVNAPNKNIRLIGEGVAGTAADDVPGDLPLSYELSQNYPNPFNPSTEISFALPQAANVKLVVFNTLGQEIAVLTDGTMSAGRHAVTFHATDLTAGVYIYRLEAGGATSSYTAIRKMMLVK